MRTIKNGLIQILFPVILTGNIHGRRLGYTYDRADNGSEYGLSEFIIKKDSDVKVAYTVELKEMLNKLDNDSWNPADCK